MTTSTWNRRLLSVCSLASILVPVVSPFACGSSPRDTVGAKVEVVDRTTHALTSGTLEWVNGIYGATCFGHTGGDGWSLRVAGSNPMTSPALSVTKNDVACQLTVTALMADVIYESSPTIPLTTAYAGTASSFATRIANVLQPVAFYANAKISATDFASDFIVTILYSDDVRSASPSTGATYQQFTGGTATTQVPAPDYTSGFSAMIIQVDVNATVSTATGSMDLIAGSNPGEEYVIVAGSGGSTFAEIDATYAAGTKVAVATSISASSFLNVGDQLPTVRTVIISHTVSGVVAYEAIHITFNAP
jgi:hypothetical protein